VGAWSGEVAAKLLVAAFLSAGAAACLVGCMTGAPIPPTYTQDELKATCERNGLRWYRDDLEGGFCERK
jgi:hypothetical protein